jgi:hypothetical protein
VGVIEHCVATGLFFRDQIQLFLWSDSVLPVGDLAVDTCLLYFFQRSYHLQLQNLWNYFWIQKMKSDSKSRSDLDLENKF